MHMGTLTFRSLAVLFTACFASNALASAPAPDPTEKTIAGDYLTAQAAELKGDWKLAAGLLTGISQRKHDPGILRQAFLISLGAGNFDQALKLSAEIKPDMPEHEIALTLQAADAIKRNDLAGAGKLVTTLPDSGINIPLKLILQAWVKAGSNDTAGAVAELNKLQQFDTYRLLHTALIAELAGDRAKADSAYETLAKDTPQSRIAAMMAAYYRRTGRPQRAGEVIDRLPSDNNMAAISLRAATDLDQPKPTLASGTAEAAYDMAELLLEARHPDIALFYAAIAQYLDPAQCPPHHSCPTQHAWPDTHLLLGEIEQAQNRHIQAAANFLEVPDNAAFGLLAHLDAALAYEQAGVLDKAIKVAEDLVKSHPTSPQAQIALGDMLRRNKQYPPAIAAYGKALATMKQDDPLRVDVIFTRAIAYDQIHDDKAAEADLQQAVALAPDRANILNYLGFFWASRDENLDKAHDLLDRAYKLAPTDGAVADSLGWVLYQQGDYTGAVKQLEQAVALQPGDSEINGHLGDAYWRIGRTNEARFQWRHALLNATGPAVGAFETKLRDGLVEAPAAKPHTEDDKTTP